jgi:hypothetical protein
MKKVSNRCTFWLAALALGIVFMGAEGSASAGLVTTPYGNDPVRVTVGKREIGFGFGHVVIFENLLDRRCQVVGIGGAALTDDHLVEAGGGNDVISVLQTMSLGGACGVSPLWPPNYDWHYIDFIGNGGDDTLSSGSGDTWLFGNGGNDVLQFANPSGSLAGGPGNDVLRSLATSGFQSLSGNAGDDCLSAATAATAVFYCHDGTDRYVSGPQTFDCEVPVSSCP